MIGTIGACLRAALFYGLGIPWTIFLLCFSWLLLWPRVLGGSYVRRWGMWTWARGLFLLAGIVFIRNSSRIRVRAPCDEGAAGNLVLAASHQSYLDIPLLFCLSPGETRFVIRKKVRSGAMAPFGKLAQLMGHFFIDERNWQNRARRFLESTGPGRRVIVVFPEGSRRSDPAPDGLQEFRSGWHLMVPSETLIQVVALLNADEALGRGETTPRWQGVARFCASEPLGLCAFQSSEGGRTYMLDLFQHDTQKGAA